MLLDLPEELRFPVTGQILAHYPDCRLEPVEEPLAETPEREGTWTAHLALSPDILPGGRTHKTVVELGSDRADPLTALLAAIRVDGRSIISCQVELLVRPATKRDTKALVQILAIAAGLSPGLAKWYIASARSASRFRRWLAHFAALIRGGRSRRTGETPQGKVAERLLAVQVRVKVQARRDTREVAAQRLREIVGAFAVFSGPESTWKVVRRPWATFLTAEETATIFHPPTVQIRSAVLDTAESKLLEVTPRSVPARRTESATVLGLASINGRPMPFGLSTEDRLRHLLLTGKTGVGKSTMLARMLLSDIARGAGCGLLDPHGDLAESVLRAIPAHRTNDVVWFDAADPGAMRFNPLRHESPSARPLVASGIVSALKKCYPDSWGPRLEYILRNAVLTLLESQNSHLLQVLRLFQDARFRREKVARLSDPIVREFWREEFDRWPERLRAEALSPVQNKVGAFASHALLREILGQSCSRLDLRSVLDQGQVLLINLSKGRLGEDGSKLLGSFLLSSLQIAALARADRPAESRPPFFLAVDEFQSFATESFSILLSEARKYGVGLTLANQFLGQIPEMTLAAIFGNCGSLVSFQVGANDAEIIARQLGSDVSPEDLLRLPKYHAYARLLTDGEPSRPFSIATLPPKLAQGNNDRADVIRRVSRRRYGAPKEALKAL